MDESVTPNRVLQGPVFATFLYYAIPSILGLLAITTASIVDGIFVGQFVSPDALAAINLMIPYFTFLFGIAMMFSIGGAVRAGRYFGEQRDELACATFSKCLLSIIGVAVLMMILALLFDSWFLSLLGAPEHLHPLMRPYFRVISIVLVLQLSGMVLYYFVRLDAKPSLATAALVAGAGANILLDALFIVYLGWGLEGAAWATGLAQLFQLAVISRYFFNPQRRLRFVWPGFAWCSSSGSGWSEMRLVVYNGFSEFINEFSGGLVILVMNWLLVTRIGVDGIAAFTVVNYSIFLSLMVFYGVADAVHLLVSQNYGARQPLRIRQFMTSAALSICFFSSLLILLLLGFDNWVIGLFIEDESAEIRAMSAEFIRWVWPMFLVNGLNVILSVYLTAMHWPLPSMIVATCRSMALPVLLLLLLAWLFPGTPFLVALPIAEWLTFGVALLFYHRSRQRFANLAY